jgi:two-component system, OmpR family, phosphate regulon response regulator PhoB
MQFTSFAPRIALVEDDEALSILIKYNLQSEGYHVDHYRDGEEAQTRLRDTIPDLIILDWMLPNVSGIELCRRLRAWSQTQKTPIIMLTARGEESERIRGLTTGADDYMVKPFSVPELMARIKALLRRLRPEVISALLKVLDIELDREMRRAKRDGRELKLGPIEFKLLEFFMLSPNRVFSREHLLNNIWGQDVYIDDRTVDVHIGRLRKIINRGKEKDPLRTVRGAGYSFG